MATRIRLRRTGKKKQAYYRVVVADSRSPRDGRFIEILGNYNPNTDPAQITLDEERTLYWLRTGATPSETVKSLLSKKGVLARLAEERPDHPVLKRPPKRRGRFKVEEPAESAEPAEVEAAVEELEGGEPPAEPAEPEAAAPEEEEVEEKEEQADEPEAAGEPEEEPAGEPEEEPEKETGTGE